MTKLTLVIGNKNYSSWSLRPWFFLKYHGIDFEEIRIPLYDPQFDQKIAAYSPSGKVPALLDDKTTVWDSLSICEYLAEKFPQTHGWPQDTDQRALARSIACEMHSGFLDMRHALPMNCRKTFENFTFSEPVLEDIRRIQNIWETCLTASKGPWLFGDFSIADAMFAPVAIRFHIYGVTLGGALSEASKNYVDAIIKTPAIQDWIAGAKNESEIIPAFEK